MKFYFEENFLVQNEKWKKCILNDTVHIAGRIGWRGLNAKEYTKEGPLFLSVYNLADNLLVNFNNSYHITEERYNESPEIQLKNNDILLVKDGAGIGKLGIVTNLKEKATVNSSLLVIRPNDEIKPKFLLYLLLGPKMQSIVKQRITGSATPHLFQRDIKKFDFIIPSLLKQEKIINIIDKNMTVLAQNNIRINYYLKKIENLKMSILMDAFIGKIAPQCASDEQVSILLEHIHREINNFKKKNTRGWRMSNK